MANSIDKSVQALINLIGELQPVTTIETDDQQQSAAHLLAAIKTNAKELKARKDAITKPLNSALKEIRAQFKPAEDQLASVETAVKAALLEYHDRKEAEAAKEITRIENDGRLRTDTAMSRLADVDQPDTDLGGAQIKYGARKVRITDVQALVADAPSVLYHPEVMEAIRKAITPAVLAGSEHAGVQIYRERQVAGIAQ